MYRFCFSLASLVLVNANGWCGDAEIVRTTVRVDRSSGRLVRAQVWNAREVPPVGSVAGPAKAAVKAKVSAEVDEIVQRASAAHGVDPLLVRSVMQVESNFNPNAVSPKGAMGLMQLMPATAKQLGVLNAFDVRQNIEGGVKYLRYLKTKFSDDRLVLAAYNAGEGAVKKHGWIPPYPETVEYVMKVGRKYGDAKRLEEPVALPVSAERVQPKVQQLVDAEGRIHLVMP